MGRRYVRGTAAARRLPTLRGALRVLTILQLLERDGHYCPLCGEIFDHTIHQSQPLGVTIDHIKPRSKGGGDGLNNLRLAHKMCNIRRGNKEIGGS